jgi:hypothetical protein
MGTFLRWLRVLAQIVGGWWSLMSGAISIPFGFVALLTQGRERLLFAVLAYSSLWVVAIRATWANHQILVVQKPRRRRELLAKMVDFAKLSKEHEDPSAQRRSFTTYDYAHLLKGPESIGAIIKFAEEIETEQDLEWFCRQFEEAGYKAPLEPFKTILEAELKEPWLEVIREARLTPHEVKTEAQFLSFLAVSWSGKEKWRQAQARTQERNQR